jgi:UMF1 family MFS transporter
MESIELNNKRTINAWAMFDWANSSFALVIAVAVFPLYFNGVIDEEFTFLGMEMTNTALFSYALSFAYFIIALMLPLLSGIADYGGKKILFMKIFTTIGSLGCIALVFFKTHINLDIALIGFILAVIGFAGGQVFYNSYLPLIASEDQYDRVSARGFTFGYIGSVILLMANLAMIQKPEWFGLSDGAFASRVSFVMVGLWWLGFAQITFRRLPKEKTGIPLKGLVRKGYDEILKVANIIKDKKNIKRFLFSFFFYIAGVQTVIYLASTFATDELKFEAFDLILTIFILQLVAIIGAILFARISEKFGNKISLIAMLIIWSLICIAAYFVYEKFDFYLVAVAVGLVMGGIQSLSRSSYSKLIPAGTKDTASYFSFYDVLEKIAITIGTFSFGFIEQLTGGMRNSILALIIYFIIGIGLLLTVSFKKPKEVVV